MSFEICICLPSNKSQARCGPRALGDICWHSSSQTLHEIISQPVLPPETSEWGHYCINTFTPVAISWLEVETVLSFCLLLCSLWIHYHILENHVLRHASTLFHSKLIFSVKLITRYFFLFCRAHLRLRVGSSGFVQTANHSAFPLILMICMPIDVHLLSEISSVRLQVCGISMSFGCRQPRSASHLLWLTYTLTVQE